MNEKKSYKVQIFEEPYVLVSDTSEEMVAKAAALVDVMMKEISHQSTITDTKKIAVLTALRMADKLLDLEKQYQQEHEKQVALEKYLDHELSYLNI